MIRLHILGKVVDISTKPRVINVSCFISRSRHSYQQHVWRWSPANVCWRGAPTFTSSSAFPPPIVLSGEHHLFWPTCSRFAALLAEVMRAYRFISDANIFNPVAEAETRRVFVVGCDLCDHTRAKGSFYRQYKYWCCAHWRNVASSTSVRWCIKPLWLLFSALQVLLQLGIQMLPRSIFQEHRGLSRMGHQKSRLIIRLNRLILSWQHPSSTFSRLLMHHSQATQRNVTISYVACFIFCIS